MGTTLGLGDGDGERPCTFLNLRPRSSEGGVVTSAESWYREGRDGVVDLALPRIELLRPENDGEGARDCRDMLRLSIFLPEDDRLAIIGARDMERCARDDDRREATSMEGRDRRSSCCQ